MNVEVVNDSGKSDSCVYVMMTGSGITPVGGGPLSNLAIPAVDLAASPTPTNTVVCALLTTLTHTTNVVVSTLTGRTNKVYKFNLETVKSARLFVSYSPSLQFVGLTAPTNVVGYRFDKCEFDFSAAPTWAANLTSVDFLGIPLRIDAVDSTTEQPFDARSFYLSKDTISTRLAYQVSTSGGTVGKVIQRDASNNFLRILSPATITFNSTKGSADPYPSFQKYLQSLVDANYVIKSSGTQAFGTISPTWINDQTNNVVVNIPTYQATYNYCGTVAANSAGFIINMTGSMSNWSTNDVNNNSIPIPVPPMFTTVTSNTTYNSVSVTTNNVTVVNTKRGPQVIITPVTTTTYIPTTTYVTNAIGTNITLFLPTTTMDQNIYGCPLTTTSFGISNPSATYPSSNCVTTAAQTSYFNAVLGNTIYSYVVANIQSGFNFGYLNGNYPNNTSNWFKNILPPAIPFGAGRPKNDGFYNPYTAFIFNASDSYGFAFNDRSLVGTNPLISYSSTNTNMRVTVLPDNQLDAPEVTVSSTTQSGVGLTWSPVANVPANYTVSYVINSDPPFPGGPLTVSGNSKFINLPMGMPYQFSVMAKAVSPGGATTNLSYTIPIQAAAAGDNIVPSGSYTNQFTPAGWTVGVFSDPSKYPIRIGGQMIPFIPAHALSTNSPPVGTNYVGNAFGTVFVPGNVGTNYYPIIVQDSSGNTVYRNAFQVVLSQVPTNIALNSFYITQEPVLPGNSLPLDVAPPTPSPGVFPQGPFSNPGLYPTISVAGQPETFKVFTPAIFPPVQSPQQYWEQQSLKKYLYVNPLK